jgi:hypothetical protein
MATQHPYRSIGRADVPAVDAPVRTFDEDALVGAMLFGVGALGLAAEWPAGLVFLLGGLWTAAERARPGAAAGHGPRIGS